MPRDRVILEPFGRSKISPSRLDYAVKTVALAHKAEDLHLGDEIMLTLDGAGVKGGARASKQTTVRGTITAIEGDGIDRRLTVKDELGKHRHFAVRSRRLADIVKCEVKPQAKARRGSRSAKKA